MMTHPHPKKGFIPQAVLTRTGKINTAGKNVNTAGASINTGLRTINTALSTLIVNHPRPKLNAFKSGYSQSSRTFNRYYANKNSTINTNINTARIKNTTARDRAVGNPQQKEYKEKAVIDSGCSRHMTGNKSYLYEYEDYDGGFVSFGDGKGRISGKSLNYLDVEGRLMMSICSQELMKGHVTSNKSVCCVKHLSKSKEVGTPRYLSLVVLLKKVGDEAIHKELGDRMERAATT
ncbi:hypothetical protein Tco_0863730, partial [Tanacetum coccineum]